MTQLLHSHRKSPQCPLDRRLGGPQGQSGHSVKEKNFQLLPRMKLQSSNRPACSQLLYQLSYPSFSFEDKIILYLFHQKMVKIFVVKCRSYEDLQLLFKIFLNEAFLIKKNNS
jgi:hypothetical protein